MKKLSLIIGGMILSAMLFVGAVEVKANPSFFTQFQNIYANATSGTATSSPYFVTPGTAQATSTIYGDVGKGNQGSDSAVLALQINASSTLSAPVWRYEYAQDTAGVDCTKTPLACDWYSDNQLNFTNASTTYEVNVVKTYTWNYSSSTDMCSTSAAIATNNRGCKMVSVLVPTRYVRAVIYSTAASKNFSVWGNFITKQQKI